MNSLRSPLIFILHFLLMSPIWGSHHTTITRFINEIPENDFARLNNFLGPIITVSSWAIDYAGVLNIGGAVFNWAVTKYNIEEKSLHANAFDIEKAIKSVFDYSNGASLNTVTNYWR